MTRISHETDDHKPSLSSGVPTPCGSVHCFCQTTRCGGDVRLDSAETSRACIFAGLLLAAAALAGCRAPLFPDTEPPSQYERVDALSGREPPQFVYDEFGRRRPNIRGRLTAAE